MNFTNCVGVLFKFCMWTISVFVPKEIPFSEKQKKRVDFDLQELLKLGVGAILISPHSRC